jgi:hypothetical protein
MYVDIQFQVVEIHVNKITTPVTVEPAVVKNSDDVFMAPRLSEFAKGCSFFETICPCDPTKLTDQLSRESLFL